MRRFFIFILLVIFMSLFFNPDKVDIGGFDDFFHQRGLDNPYSSLDDSYNLARTAYDENYTGSPVSVGVGSAYDGSSLDLSSLSDEARAEIAHNDYREDLAFERTKNLRDTQYISTAKQLQDLGINPYVMLNGLSGASAPSVSSHAYSGYASSALSAKQSGINSIISALTALAVAKVPHTNIIVK